jgi:hypothetical protein
VDTRLFRAAGCDAIEVRSILTLAPTPSPKFAEIEPAARTIWRANAMSRRRMMLTTSLKLSTI